MVRGWHDRRPFHSRGRRARRLRDLGTQRHGQSHRRSARAFEARCGDRVSRCHGQRRRRIRSAFYDAAIPYGCARIHRNARRLAARGTRDSRHVAHDSRRRARKFGQDRSADPDRGRARSRGHRRNRYGIRNDEYHDVYDAGPVSDRDGLRHIARLHTAHRRRARERRAARVTEGRSLPRALAQFRWLDLERVARDVARSTRIVSFNRAGSADDDLASRRRERDRARRHRSRRGTRRQRVGDSFVCGYVLRNRCVRDRFRGARICVTEA